MNGEKIIEGKDLVLTRGRHRILDVGHFFLARGETVALIGPNGAGKSTLMQVLMFLQRPSGGDLFFNGERVGPKDLIKYRRRMAMVFQEPLLLDTTVYNNIASGLKIRGLPREKASERVGEWIKKLGIEHIAGRSVRYLSGGESQRVSLARALALEPEVLFLDEPFSALDAPARAALIDELAEILRDTRISSVFATHDYREIPFLADRVVVLEKGGIIQEAPPREIMTRPANLTAASLVGVENVVPGRVAGRENGKVLVQAGTHVIAASRGDFAPGEEVYLLLRPEDVKIIAGEGQPANRQSGRRRQPPPGNGEAAPGTAGSGCNIVSGKIVRLLPHGSLFKVLADCGFPMAGLLGLEEAPGGELEVGKEVCLAFSPEKAHLIKMK
ncbi:MAG: ABC transporter ATP-binding protein [Eubacteriales bacterium]